MMESNLTQKRMRNLFKILYLMVLGLEDRKSYDAFHFFGTDFIETVNFSSDYTNRSLLFRILKQIARLDYEGVRYGGVGGTNMSEGIIGCHERIKIFADQLKAKYPKRFFLKSIFVITDGEPSLGIHVPIALNSEIERRRQEGSVAIKGIYLKPKGEKYASFMETIFGKDQFVETDDFAEAINRLVYINNKKSKKNMKEAAISINKPVPSPIKKIGAMICTYMQVFGDLVVIWGTKGETLAFTKESIQQQKIADYQVNGQKVQQVFVIGLIFLLNPIPIVFTDKMNGAIGLI